MPFHRRRAAAAPIAVLAATLALGLSGCSQGEPTNDGAADSERTELGGGFGGAAAMKTHEALEIPGGSPKVLFLGDSITAGLHLPVDQAWPAALQRALHADGVPFELQNAGVSGDTTAGGLRRTDWLLKGAPDIVVIELGPNDGLRNVDLADTEANLRAIIEKVQAAGARPILTGMDVPTNLGQYAKDFAAMYPRLAEEYRIPLVPAFFDGVGGHPEMNLPDGMHPTPEGHERLAENVAGVLRDAILEAAGPGGD